MTANLSDSDALELVLVEGDAFVCCIALVDVFLLASLAETARHSRSYIRVVNVLQT